LESVLTLQITLGKMAAHLSNINWIVINAVSEAVFTIVVETAFFYLILLLLSLSGDDGDMRI